MSNLLSSLGAAFSAFFGFKAYVILPVFMLVLALAARMRPKEAVLASLRIAAGFSGIFIVFNFFVGQIGPAIKAIIALRGLDYPVVDVGWPPLAAITWSSFIAPLCIPLVILLNLGMLLARATKTLYIDLWNYWHFAFLGALLMAATGSVPIALAGTLAIAAYNIKTCEWTRPWVKRETGLEGIAISPLSVAGLLPYAVAMDRLFGAIPGLRRLDWNPSRARRGGKEAGLLEEPMAIGFLVGLFLSVFAGYGLKETLETSVNIAAVMFVLPRCGGLIGEGMGAVSLAVKTLVERRFAGMRGLSIAVDTGVLLGNPSVTATGLVLIPVSLLLAFVLPGNRVIPLGDLPNLISIMSVTTIAMGGNVVRAVLAGIPVVATFMLFSSALAPVITRLSAQAGLAAAAAGQEITAFTDGGSQVRYWMYWLFQGNLAALALAPAVAALLWYTWKRHKALSLEEEAGKASPGSAGVR